MERLVYKGQIVQVTEEVIHNTKWERVYVPHGVIVYPITDEGKVLLIEERRPHENPPVRIKAVSGIFEPDKGSPAQNAQREMQEEIGLKADKLDLLMELKGSGTINHTQYFFTARGLTPSKLPNPDGEDTILSIKAYSLDEILQQLMKDEMKWSMSTLGLLRLYHTININ